MSTNKNYNLEEKNRFQKIAMSFLEQSSTMLNKFNDTLTNESPDWAIFDEYNWLYDKYKENMDESDRFWKLYISEVKSHQSYLPIIDGVLDKLKTTKSNK